VYVCAKYPCGQVTDLDCEVSWPVAASVSWILYMYTWLLSDPVLSCYVDVSVEASGCRLQPLVSDSELDDQLRPKHVVTIIYYQLD
jgi:hypothetical protein